MLRTHLPFAEPGAYRPDELSAFYRELHESGRSTFYDRATELQVVWCHADVGSILLGRHRGVVNANSLDPLTPMREFMANPATWPHLVYLLRHVRPATANAVGEHHDSVRRVLIDRHDPRSINPAMTVEHYGSLVEAQSDRSAQALSEQAGASPVDFARVFAGPLAATIIGQILGFPGEAAIAIQRWAHGQASLLGRRMRGKDLTAAVAALAELSKACGDLVVQRSRHPENDLATLLAEPHSGQALPPRLAASAAMNLIAAGYITTYGTLLNSTAYLLSPAGRRHWDALGDPAHGPGLVAELLRRETALVGWKRRARSEVRLADGSAIPAGRQILALIGAANCDPRVFPQPYEIRPGRNAAGNPVLTFGLGPHSCVGSGLATLELETALRALRQRFPGMRLVSAQTGYAPDNLFRVPDSLPVALAP